MVLPNSRLYLQRPIGGLLGAVVRLLFVHVHLGLRPVLALLSCAMPMHWRAEQSVSWRVHWAILRCVWPLLRSDARATQSILVFDPGRAGSGWETRRCAFGLKWNEMLGKAFRHAIQSSNRSVHILLKNVLQVHLLCYLGLHFLFYFPTYHHTEFGGVLLCSKVSFT